MFLCNSVMAHVHEMIDVTARLRSGSRYESERQLNDLINALLFTEMTAPMTPAHTLGLLPVSLSLSVLHELNSLRRRIKRIERTCSAETTRERACVRVSLSLFLLELCASTRVKRWEEHRKTSVLTSSVCGVYFWGKRSFCVRWTAWST